MSKTELTTNVVYEIVGKDRDVKTALEELLTQIEGRHIQSGDITAINLHFLNHRGWWLEVVVDH